MIKTYWVFTPKGKLVETYDYFWNARAHANRIKGRIDTMLYRGAGEAPTKVRSLGWVKDNKFRSK